jgi:hypothetical protein
VLDAARQWKGIFASTPVISPIVDGVVDFVNGSRYFILQGNNITGKTGSTFSSQAAYFAHEGDAYTFAPQFTPDRRFLSFRNGDWGWSHPSFDLWYWELAKRDVINVNGSRRVHFPLIQWTQGSERIAYVTGGDSIGTEDDGPTTLKIYDTTLHTTKEGVPHPLLNGGTWLDFRSLPYFSWANNHTLLFAKRYNAKGGHSTSQNILPDIWQIDAVSNRAQRVVHNGFAPLPSPNGKWIAYVGWPHLTTPQQIAGVASTSNIDMDQARARSARLYLYNVARKTSIAVGNIELSSTARHTVSDFTYRWTPDSSSLVTLSAQHEFPIPKPQATPTAAKHTWAFPIDIIDVKNITANSKTARSTRSARILRLPYYPYAPCPIELHSISRDGHYFFIKKQEHTLKKDNLTPETLLAIRIKTGEVQQVASFQPQNNLSYGWDWYEEP